MFSLIIYLTLITLFLILTGLAACAETAFTSASPAAIRELADRGDARAETALYFMEKPERFLVTLLLNSNLWNVSLVTISQMAIAAYVVNTEWFRSFIRLCGGDMDTHWDELLTSIVMTAVVLVFADLLPKAIAKNNANRLVLIFARPMLWNDRLLRRLLPVSVLTKMSRRLIRRLGISESQPRTVTREDLQLLARTMTEQGTVDDDMGDMLETALELQAKPVDTIMVPLVSMRLLPLTATFGEAEAQTAETGFAVLPVYDGRVDNIVGEICVQESVCRRTELPDDAMRRQPVADFLNRQITYVPDTLSLLGLWDEMRRLDLSHAYVVDEYGGIRGMVTLEDLAFHVMGSMCNTEAKEHYSVIRRTDAGIECDGRLDVHALEEALGCELDDSGVATAAGLVIRMTGRIPVPGEIISGSSFTATILEADGRRIRRLRFTTKK